MKLTRLNQIDFKIFYLLAQEKKGIIINFGPVVANSIKIWKTVERRIGGPFKFCNSTPLWHNFNFVCGNRPFVQPSWSSLGVNTCGDIYDNKGLCSFQTLRTKFCLPTSAYFVFLQLRSALKAYGVPWASSISSHPMRDWIAPSAGRPSVSLKYNKIIDCITKPLSIKTIWNRELSDLKGIVHFEIKIWYVSAYPKGIQDVGVFFSSVDPILMFLGQTVLVCQSYNGRYRSLSLKEGKRTCTEKIKLNNSPS